MPPRNRTVVVAAAVSALVFFAMFGAIGTKLYAFPRTDKPAKTDVIFVIGPPSASRIELAQQMMAKGLSDNLMISTSPIASSRFNQGKLPICSAKKSYHVYCGVPSPLTTQGEARWLGSMTEQYGWTSATVITFTPHVTRARLIISRCYSGDLRMVADKSGIGPLDWLYEYLYQSGALIKALLTPEC